MSPHGFSLLLQTHSMILEGSLTALCVHLFVHHKLPEKPAVVGLVSLVLLEVVLGALCPCRGPTAEGSVALGGPGDAAPAGWAAESLWSSTRVGEMSLLPLSSSGWSWLCLHTSPGLPLEAVMATAGEESISWNIYLLNKLSSWLVVVLLVKAAVVRSECDKSVGNTWRLVFFVVPDAGQWPGNTQGERQQPPLKTHGETAAPGTWALPSPFPAVPPSLLVTNYLSQGFLCLCVWTCALVITSASSYSVLALRSQQTVPVMKFIVRCSQMCELLHCSNEATCSVLASARIL